MTNQEVLPPRRKRGVMADMVNDLGFGQPPRISIKGGRFAIVDAAGHALPANFVDQTLGYYIDIVIADANPVKSKIFFGRDYQDGDDSPPLCFSDNGVAPSTNAGEPQSQSCAVCQHNMLGSAVSRLTGDAVKACRDQKKLAAFVVGAPNADELYLFTITPGSLKNLRAYAGTLATNKLDPADVVTRVFFVAGATGVLNFVSTSEIDQTMDARIEKALDDNRTDAICGRNDVARPANAPLLPARQPTQALPPPSATLDPRTGQPWQPGATLPPPNPPPQQFQQPEQQQAAPAPVTKGRGRGRAAAAPPPPQTNYQQPAPNQPPPVAPFMPQAAPPVHPGFHQDQGGIPAGLVRQPPPPAAGFGTAPGGHTQPPPPPGPPPGAAQPGYGMVNPAPVADPRTQEALRNAFANAATPARQP